MRDSGEHQALLDVRGVSKSFRVPGLRKQSVQALKPVSFELRPGELLIVEGPSGAGKTTLLQCLARLTAPDDGAIVWRGTDVTHLAGGALRDYRKHVRLLFQHPSSALDPRFTALESVAESLLLGGSPRAEATVMARQTLDRVGAKDLADRLPGGLSGGERQRVALARALAGAPELILADEPVSALDEAARDEALSLLLGLQRQLGFACVLVSHAPVVDARRLRL